MTTTKAGQKAVNKYVKKNYDRIPVMIKKGKKEEIQEIAKGQGESVNGYIKTAIKQKVKADTGKEIEL